MQREERTLCVMGVSSGRCIVLPAVVHRFATLFCLRRWHGRQVPCHKGVSGMDAGPKLTRMYSRRPVWQRARLPNDSGNFLIL
jgi:hypothetical protein